MIIESYSLTSHPLQLQEATEQRRDEDKEEEEVVVQNHSLCEPLFLVSNAQPQKCARGRRLNGKVKQRGKPMTMAVAEHLLLS